MHPSYFKTNHIIPQKNRLCLQNHHYFLQKRQSGFVLIIGLIFILIISVVTVSSMQSSNLDYKIATNSIFKTVAFENSESGRIASGDAISYFMYYRSWSGFSRLGLIPPDDYDPSIDNLGSITIDGNQVAESLLDTNYLNIDLTYNVNTTDIEPINSDINIIKGFTVPNYGSGLQQSSGYDGLGKGIGTGGAHLLYEIRSTGTAASDARAVTAAEYRVIP